MRFLASFPAVAFLFGATLALAEADIEIAGDVVVMGELHDVAAHHANQADWIARLAPSAVVFEMLEAEQGPIATELQAAPVAELGAALAWEARGWPDFGTYAPIFRAAGGARIYGAGVPRVDLSHAVEDGAASVVGKAETRRFALDRPLPPSEQALREDDQERAHCGLMPPEMLAGMVEAQRLRDAVLARTALRAFDETGGPVAIVTGNGHARKDWGVPRFLKTARPDLAVMAIGQFTEAEADAPFDQVVVAGRYGADRPDPCDALR